MHLISLASSVLAVLSASAAVALNFPEYRGLKTAQNGTILEVTFHNPDSDINLWGVDFQEGVSDIVRRLRNDTETKVVIFKSDVPQFFCAHLDLLMPGIESVGARFATLMFEISNLPQVTIGAVEGRARGAGNELLMALDMRFASESETLLGQMEVGTGLLPGGGGSQHLPRLIGRGLAMEYLLSGKDINAREAERIGWINKAFCSSEAMYAHIEELTARLSLFPLAALTAVKEAVNHRSRPSLEDLLQDAASFNRRLSDPAVGPLLARSLALTNNLTFGEMELHQSWVWSRRSG